MKLYYWSGSPNFGDALNPWLWPRLLPGYFDDDPARLFIGIGSNLNYSFPPNAEKMVCGTGYGGPGYGGFSGVPAFDETWDIRFVRGPRTAAALGLAPSLALGDPAALVHCFTDGLPAADEHHAVGFVPHWECALYGAWEAVCAEAGVRFIDPRWPVERVIAAIRSCERIVSQAMHGAIVADALRVPWVPFFPSPMQRFKWFDWAESQRLEITFSPAAPSTWLELAFCALEARPELQDVVAARGLRARTFGSRLFRSRARAALREAVASRPYLTAPDVLEATTRAMRLRLDALRPRQVA